ncbi:MAG: SurA N-terminal domain-containing protein [Thermodesulfovibrionaceae bacterium]
MRFFKIFCLFILTFSPIFSYAAETFFVDKVVAVVNREVITWSELYKFMEFSLRDKIQLMNPDEKFKYFREQQQNFLERLIDTKLQLEEAEKFGIFVSDSEIETAVAEIKRKYRLTDKEFEEALKKEGLTLKDYKKMLKDEITIGRAVNSLVRSKIVITDSEIKSYILSNPELVCDDEGYYVSQIFIRRREDEGELKSKLDEILRKLIEGVSFSKVASQFSEDSSAKTGGAIGLLKKKEIAEPLSQLFSKMSVGQISEPMLTEGGVYIFRLDGVCFPKDSEKLYNYVRSNLEEERFKKEYKLWVRSLRQRSYIEIME